MPADDLTDVGSSSNSTLSLHAHHHINQNGGKVSQSAPGSPKHGEKFCKTYYGVLYFDTKILCVGFFSFKFLCVINVDGKYF